MGGFKLALFWLFLVGFGIYFLNELKSGIAWTIFWVVIGIYAIIIFFKVISLIDE